MDAHNPVSRHPKSLRIANLTLCLLSLGFSILSLALDGFTVAGVIVINIFVLFNLFFLSFHHKTQLFYLTHRVCAVYVFFGIIALFIQLPLLVSVIVALA